MSTAEYRYILDLAAALVRSGPPPAPPDDLRWRTVLELLARHRLTVTVGHAIDSGALPDALAKELAGTLRALRVRHGWYLIELDRVLDALERSGCRTLVLKGGALNHTVYVGRAPRYVSDLDILVRKNELETACAVLSRLGFRAAMDRRSPAYYETHHFHRILRNEAGVTVEVHWQLARPADWVTFDIDGIFSRSRCVATAGREIPMACEADQLLDTAFQSLGDGFWNLRRLIDAAFSSRQERPMIPGCRTSPATRDSEARSGSFSTRPGPCSPCPFPTP